MKFRLKMTLCMLCLLSLLFGAGGTLLITFSFRESLNRERSSAYHTYQSVLGTLQVVNSVNRQLDYEDISNTLKKLSEQIADSWSALRLYTEDTTIYEDGAFVIPASGRPATTEQCTIRYASLNGTRQIVTVSGALEAGDATLHLEIAFDISSVFVFRETQQQFYLRVFLILVALCAVLSYSLSSILTRPLSELSKASRAISAGKLSKRAKIFSEDEVGLVAKDFNAMAENLEKNIFELKAAMERQERFVGSFAHEVKTPMTSIIGYADLIRSETLDAEEQRQAVNFIVSEGRRLEHLSQKLLELLLTNQENVAFQAVDPAALIHGLVSHILPIYKKQRIMITCDCENGLCLLEADLVKSLLVNVLDNARKAMDGQLGYIHVKSVMLSDGCRISVQDSGRGIPAEALGHLTEAFYRVDKSRSRAQGGAGLGLALCQEIVALHNGTLRFESRPGRGTTVIVELRGGCP